jgi:hypothetical protein
MCNLLSLDPDFLRRKRYAYLLAFWPEAGLKLQALFWLKRIWLPPYLSACSRVKTPG